MSDGEREPASVDEPGAPAPPERRYRLAPADRVVLAYGIFVLAVVLWSRPPRWPLLALAQLALVAAVPLLARRARRFSAGVWSFLHRWYPVMLLLVLYPQAGALRHLLVARDLDPLVLRWEDALFPGRWWATLPPRLSLAAREVVHAAYFSYYLLLFLPALLARRRARALVAEYVSVLAFTLLLHFAASFLLPVGGPPLGHAASEGGGPFGVLVALAYRFFDRGGLAFPSTHVAAAVVAAWYGAKLYPARRSLYALWAAAITASTVLGAFHYTIDAAAGLLTGGACLAAGTAWWRRDRRVAIARPGGASQSVAAGSTHP